MRATTKESAVLRSVLQYLTLARIWHWRSNAGVVPLPGGGFRRYAGLRGVADILGVLGPDDGHDGRIIAIEVKSATGRLRKDQKAFLANVNRRGGLGLVVRSVNDLHQQLVERGVVGP